MKSCLILCALLFLTFMSCLAQIPQLLNFQGAVSDSDGVVLEGSFSLTFRIYDDSDSKGIELWSETQTVIITQGLFNVKLGSSNALNIPFDAPYWISIQIGNDSELDPRIQLVSAPYSLNSLSAFNALNSDMATQALSAETSEIAASIEGTENVFPGAGNVGVGTTIPSEKLEVSGNVLATKFIGDGSELTNLPTPQTAAGIAGTENVFPGAGNVGVGTTTPTEKIEVLGNISATKFIGDGSELTNLPAVTGLTGSENIFPGSGNVGIGTIAPGEKLQVLGNVNATKFIGDGSELTNLPITSTPWQGTGNIFYNGGNVTIGSVTSSLVPLSIDGQAYVRGNGEATDGFIFAPTIDFAIDDNDSGLDVPADGNLALWTNNVERLRVTSVGSIGIGTTAPSNLLHVMDPSGSGFNGIRVETNAPTGGSLVALKNDDPSAFAQIGLNGSSNGIYPNALFITQNGNHPIKFGTSFVDRMIILGDGKVGVGTLIPNTILNVNASFGTDPFRVQVDGGTKLFVSTMVIRP